MIDTFARVAGIATLLFLLGACGGGSGTDLEPFDIQPDATPQPPGGSTTPPPAPPSAPVWDADAFPHARILTFGSFPSDLVRHGDTLFASDADEIDASGAKIRAVDISGASPVASGRFPSTTIRAT